MHNDDATPIRIGVLAAMLGLNPKTIRYYESIGLLPPPRRSPSGYRLYATADFDRLRFIGTAKTLGFSLAEIRTILVLRQGGRQPCQHVLGLIDRKLAAVDAQLHALAAARRQLIDLRESAGRGIADDARFCGIIEQHQPLHP